MCFLKRFFRLFCRYFLFSFFHVLVIHLHNSILFIDTFLFFIAMAELIRNEKHKILSAEGFLYHRHRVGPNFTTYRCAQRTAVGCKAYIHYHNENHLVLKGEHTNHLANPEFIEGKKLVVSCLEPWLGIVRVL